VSEPRPPSPAEAPGGLSSDPLVGELVDRCTFPCPGSDLVCGVSGGPTHWPCWYWPWQPGVRSPPSTSTTVCALDRRFRGGGGGHGRTPVRRLVPVGAREHRGRAQPRGAGARRPAPGARAHACNRAHCRRPGRDGAGQPAARVGGARPGGHAGRAHPPMLGLRRSETVALCRHLGAHAGPRPVQRRPPVRPQPRASPAAPSLLGHRRARRGAGAGPSGRSAGRRRRSPRRGGLSRRSRGCPSPGRAPPAVASRSVRAWLTGDGPYPPPLDAVERVVEVARRQRRATELGAGSPPTTPTTRPCWSGC
jgi:hypothetical protein